MLPLSPLALLTQCLLIHLQTTNTSIGLHPLLAQKSARGLMPQAVSPHTDQSPSTCSPSSPRSSQWDWAPVAHSSCLTNHTSCITRLPLPVTFPSSPKSVPWNYLPGKYLRLLAPGSASEWPTLDSRLHGDVIAAELQQMKRSHWGNIREREFQTERESRPRHMHGNQCQDLCEGATTLEF